MKVKQYRKPRYKRHARVRAKVKGTAERPRLSVFRSNKHLFVQIIDDEKGHTLVSVSDLKKTKIGTKTKFLKIKVAEKIGQEIAKKALEKGIKQVVFDRGGYAYHGRVKAVAEGARKGGLEF